MFRWIYKIPLRLHSFFRRKAADADLSGELNFHLQELSNQFIARGMKPEEAHYAALRELGGMEQIKEECREMRGVSNLENLLQDISFAARSLIRNPGFSFVVVFTLALGMGANTAIFSLVNAALLRPLPYPDPGRLVGVWNMNCPKGGVWEYRQRLRSVEIAAFSADIGFNLSGNGEAVRLTGSSVTANLLSMLGAQPKLGRLFEPDDEKPGKSRVVILGETVWQKRFGADPAIVGRSIVLDDVPRQVIGILPADFRFLSQSAELWVPIEFNVADRSSLWGPFLYTMIGRLRPGADYSFARAEYKTVVPQAVKAYPWPMGNQYGSWSDLTAMQQHAVSDLRPTLLILSAAVALVLLIACANVANLLLARSAPRQKELAVRSALGASRKRILRQLLTESVFLGIVGGMSGLLLAYLTLRVLRTSLTGKAFWLAHASLDFRVLGFAALLSILTGLIFGLVPAWQASRSTIEQALRSNSLTAGGRARTRLSSGLVVAEIALSVVLVSAAGLLIRSLWQLSQMQTGFQTDHLLTARISPTVNFCRTHNGCIDFYRELLDEMRGIPGVKHTAFADNIPLTGLPVTALAVEERPEFSANSPYQAWEFQVTPEYLSTMGIPLLRGRNIGESDTQNGPRVVLVSKALAQVFWPGEDPLGKHVKPSWQPDWRTVVGVVDDVAKYKALPGKSYTDWATNIKGDIYVPAAQGIVAPPVEMTLSLRLESGADLQAVRRQLVDAVARVNPAVPVSKVEMMDQIVADSVSTPRSTMWLFVAFAGLALLLGVVGIYSVISYSVTQRTREIGVRMAMGARKWDVLKMILLQGSRLTALGILLGIVSAFVLTRLMMGLLYGVRPSDPLTIVGVVAVVSVAAFIASLIPSHRATRVDPTIALKYE